MGIRSSVAKWLLKTVELDELFGEGSFNSVSWSAGNYDKISREGYEMVTTVYRCVNLLATICSGIPIGVFEDTEEGEELIKKHPFVKLFRRPNDIMSRALFIKFWVMSILLGGRAIIWANKLDSGKVAEMWVIPPNEVEVEWASTYGVISKITWTHEGNQINLDPEDVIYTWLPNPRDFLEPLSPLKAAAQEIDISNQGLAWNLGLMKNYGKPPFYVHLDPKSESRLKKDDVDEIKKALRNEYAGPDGVARAPVFKKPGLMITQFGFSPTDLDFLKGLDTADVRIAMVFNIPPEFVTANKTYENFSVANRVLHEQGALPLMDLLTDQLTNWLLLGLGEDEFIAVIRSEVRALQEDKDSLSKRMTTEVNTGIRTRNEARKPLGLPGSDDPMADVLTVGKEVAVLGITEFNSGTESVEEEPDSNIDTE